MYVEGNTYFVSIVYSEYEPIITLGSKFQLSARFSRLGVDFLDITNCVIIK